MYVSQLLSLGDVTVGDSMTGGDVRLLAIVTSVSSLSSLSSLPIDIRLFSLAASELVFTKIARKIKGNKKNPQTACHFSFDIDGKIMLIGFVMI